MRGIEYGGNPNYSTTFEHMDSQIVLEDGTHTCIQGNTACAVNQEHNAYNDK